MISKISLLLVTLAMVEAHSVEKRQTTVSKLLRVYNFHIILFVSQYSA